MASCGFQGSATPSPFASVPQRSHVEGMNCIQPIAPAELGPMLRPKFESTLLIAASTCHSIPYDAPARCQTPRSCAYESCVGASGGVRNEGGSRIEPEPFGVSKLGSAGASAGSTAKVSACAVPATSAAASTSAASATRIDYPAGTMRRPIGASSTGCTRVVSAGSAGTAAGAGSGSTAACAA